MSRALVTGAAGRLGRAMAIYLAQRGYDVAVHYATSAGGADETAKAVKEAGARAVTLQADLLDMDAVEALVPRAAEALGGPLTLLINNASSFEPDELGTITAQSWEQQIGSNLRAPVFLTQSFAAQAPKATDLDGEPLAQAQVIHMIDQRVRKLTPRFASYTLAKSALWTFTQTTAQALAPHVRVNAIAPGPTLQSPHQTAKDFAAQRAATLLHRGADPADISAALGYLIDAKAVTGQMIAVDGGQHLAWETADVADENPS